MSFAPQPSASSVFQRRSAPESMVACLRETFSVVFSCGLATEQELVGARAALERSAASGPPGDILEAIVKVQGTEPELIPAEVMRLSSVISKTVEPLLPLIPFAGRLMTPAGFYSSFPDLKVLAQMLMAPVLYAEDTDAIGVGALNPVAARIMAEGIVSAVDHRLGVKPFVTAVRMDYESWSVVTHKLFSL